jgi:hypothetical protein
MLEFSVLDKIRTNYAGKINYSGLTLNKIHYNTFITFGILIHQLIVNKFTT